MMTAFVTTFTEDPRKARINFFEVVGADTVVEQHRRTVMRGFAELIATQWRAAIDRGELPDAPLGSLPVALVGATQELLVEWSADARGRPVEDLVHESSTSTSSS